MNSTTLLKLLREAADVLIEARGDVPGRTRVLRRIREALATGVRSFCADCGRPYTEDGTQNGPLLSPGYVSRCEDCRVSVDGRLHQECSAWETWRADLPDDERRDLDMTDLEHGPDLDHASAEDVDRHNRAAYAQGRTD